MLQLLETRLDNVIYRMGFAVTRPAARQLVSHRGVLVNGKIVNLPSYHVKPGDIVALFSESTKVFVCSRVVDYKRSAWFRFFLG